MAKEDAKLDYEPVDVRDLDGAHDWNAPGVGDLNMSDGRSDPVNEHASEITNDYVPMQQSPEKPGQMYDTVGQKQT